jgi:hypothetical protein
MSSIVGRAVDKVNQPLGPRRGGRGLYPIFTAVPLTATIIMPLVSPSTS